MNFKGWSDYGGFFLQDSNIVTGEVLDSFHSLKSPEKEFWIHTVDRGMILFNCHALTCNKNDELFIELNLVDSSPSDNSFEEWDNVVETSISITSDSLALTTLPDGEDYPFGLFPLSKGTYRLCIFCREVQEDTYKKYEEVAPKNYEDGNYDPWECGLELKIYIWTGEIFEQRILYQTNK